MKIWSERELFCSEKKSPISNTWKAFLKPPVGNEVDFQDIFFLKMRYLENTSGLMHIIVGLIMKMWKMDSEFI